MYAFGYGLQRALGFLMLPLYTRAMGPDEYGVLGVLLAVAAATMMILPLGLDIAILRRYFQFADDPPLQERFVASTWRFLIWFPIGAAVLISAGAWPLITAKSDRVAGLDVLLMMLGAALWVAGTTVPFAVLRAEQMLRKYLVITGVSAGSTVLLTGLFVVAFDWGVRGWLAATVVTNILILIAAVVIVPWRPGVKYDGSLVASALRFSLPLLPQSTSSWALQMADRAVMAGMITAASLGVYTLAANIATPVLMLQISLNQGLMPTYAKAGAGKLDDAELRQTVVLQVALTALITLGGCLLAPPVVELVTPTEYHDASSLVSWLILGYGLFGLYFIPMNGATLGAGRGKFAWVATTGAVMVNVLLLILLVPSHGTRAAAIASAVAYFALLVGNGWYAHSGTNPVRYTWSRILPGLAIASAIYVVAQMVRPDDALAEIVFNCGVLLATSAFFVFSPLVLGVEIGRFRSILRRRVPTD